MWQHSENTHLRAQDEIFKLSILSDQSPKLRDNQLPII